MVLARYSCYEQRVDADVFAREYLPCVLLQRLFTANCVIAYGSRDMIGGICNVVSEKI